MNKDKFILIDLSTQINSLKSYLINKWLPTVDIEAFLSIVFSCFNSLENLETNTLYNAKWVSEEFLSSVELSDIQKEFLQALFIKITQDIYNELLNVIPDKMNSEYFNYEFKQLLPAGSIVLSKINSS